MGFPYSNFRSLIAGLLLLTVAFLSQRAIADCNSDQVLKDGRCVCPAPYISQHGHCIAPNGGDAMIKNPKSVTGEPLCVGSSCPSPLQSTSQPITQTIDSEKEQEQAAKLASTATKQTRWAAPPAPAPAPPPAPAPAPPPAPPTPEIACNWNGESRWLSSGVDGWGAGAHGIWISCYNNKITKLEHRGTSPTSAATGPNGTGDPEVGCEWSGKKMISHGWDGYGANGTGANVYCDNGKVTQMSYFNGMWLTGLNPQSAIRTGNLECTWSGVFWLSNGWDGGGAFSIGAGLTCNSGKLTHIRWYEQGGGAMTH